MSAERCWERQCSITISDWPSIYVVASLLNSLTKWGTKMLPQTLSHIAQLNNLTMEDVNRVINKARRSMEPRGRRVQVVEDQKTHAYTVTRLGVGPLTTPFGA